MDPNFQGNYSLHSWAVVTRQYYPDHINTVSYDINLASNQNVLLMSINNSYMKEKKWLHWGKLTPFSKIKDLLQAYKNTAAEKNKTKNKSPSGNTVVYDSTKSIIELAS